MSWDRISGMAGFLPGHVYKPALVLLAVLPLRAQDDFCQSPIGVSHLLSESGRCEVIDGGNTTMVWLTDNAEISWERFRLPQGHLLRFEFTNPAHTVVNRSIGRSPSMTSVKGELRSNGNVVLLSPESWLEFGSSARVEVGSFTASGLDAEAEQFFGPSRTWQFQATDWTNSVTRIDGQIAATRGDVVLVGRDLRINADLDAAGAVVAVSGEKSVTITPGSQESTVTDEGRQIAQNGRIAAGGEIALVGGSTTSLAGELIPGRGQGRLFVRVADGGRILANPHVEVRGRTDFSTPIEGSLAIIGPDEGDNPGARAPAVNEVPRLGARKANQRARPTSSTITSRAGTGFTRAEEEKPRRKIDLAKLKISIRKRAFFAERQATVQRGN